MNPLIASVFQDIFDYVRQGGYVLPPLMGISVWMWYLIVKKLAVLGRWRFRGKGETGEFTAIRRELMAGHVDDTGWERRRFHAPVRQLIRQRQNELERHVQTIFVLAAIAPLLGLLGTVGGMITTFEAISRFGAANARAMAGGISEALITTQAGLIVAVPGLLMGHFIRRRTDALQQRLERLRLRHSATGGAEA